MGELKSPTELLPIALRAFASPVTPQAKATRRSPRARRTPDLMLVLDTETGVDRAQRLLFGIARLYRRGRAQSGHARAWQPVQEWVFHGEDIAESSLAVLRADVQKRFRDPAPSALLGRRDFAAGPFYQLAYRAEALVVGFNLPFDLARIAVGWGIARRRATAGGFTMPLIEYRAKDGSWRPNGFRPRVGIKTIDSKRHLIQFLAGRRADLLDRRTHGHFLDLRTLAFALTNQSHSLESACGAYDIPYKKRTVEHGLVTAEYVEYCREDVQATFELAVAVLADFDEHPISLDYKGRDEDC